MVITDQGRRERSRRIIPAALVALFIVLALVLAGGLAPSSQAAGLSHEGQPAPIVPVAPLAAISMPTEGVFENCPLSARLWRTCLLRLWVMRFEGFQVVVLPADSGSPAYLYWYAFFAKSIGMRVMWNISDPGWWEHGSVAPDYRTFALWCGCEKNSALVAFMVHFFSRLPGTYGYYAADDSVLEPGDRAGVAGYVAAIKAVDPVHPVVLASSQESQTAEYEGIGDMNAAELYPVTTRSLTPALEFASAWDAVGQTAAEDQRIAESDGKPSAFILQAFTFGDALTDGEGVGVCTSRDTPRQCSELLQYPTAAAQLELRNQVLLNAHPRLILWYSFEGTVGQPGASPSVSNPGKATAVSRLDGLSAAVKAPTPSGL